MLDSQMAESMDIVFLVVNGSLMNPFISTIKSMISSFINPLLEQNYDIRLGLIKRSADGFSLPIGHSFTKSIVDFNEWFDDIPVGQHSQNGTTEICDTLREALKFNWRTETFDRCHENIVFLVTDGFPCLHLVKPTEVQDDDGSCACDELWAISDTFVNRNLTLMIVGVGQIVSVCDNLYGAIARNTGGEYIPLVNAIRVLFLTLQSVITQGDTLSQSLRHIKREEFEKDSSYHYSIMEKQDPFEIKHCQMMAQKGAWLLNQFH